MVVVEDEGITLLQLRRMLAQAGMQVVGAAGNGQEAVEVALRERPDLVVMDIKMPVMDGLEAARRILETYSVCIVMLTAFSTEEYQQQARDIGTYGYVLKPITSTTLLPQLDAALQKFQEANSAPGSTHP